MLELTNLSELNHQVSLQDGTIGQILTQDYHYELTGGDYQLTHTQTGDVLTRVPRIIKGGVAEYVMLGEQLTYYLQEKVYGDGAGAIRHRLHLDTVIKKLQTEYPSINVEKFIPEPPKLTEITYSIYGEGNQIEVSPSLTGYTITTVVGEEEGGIQFEDVVQGGQLQGVLRGYLTHLTPDHPLLAPVLSLQTLLGTSISGYYQYSLDYLLGGGTLNLPPIQYLNILGSSYRITPGVTVYIQQEGGRHELLLLGHNQAGVVIDLTREDYEKEVLGYLTRAVGGATAVRHM